VQIARLEEKKEEKQEARKEAAATVPPTPPAQAPKWLRCQKPRRRPRELAKTAEESKLRSRSGDATGKRSPTILPTQRDEHANNVPASPDPAGEMSANTCPPATWQHRSQPSSRQKKPPRPPREDRLYADLKVQSLIDLARTALQNNHGHVGRRTIRLRRIAARGKGQDFLAGLDPKQKETLQAMNNPQSVVADELAQAKLLRALQRSPTRRGDGRFLVQPLQRFRQQRRRRILITNYEQDVIRPHALGKFEDLLVATAKSPAMLFTSTTG